MTAEEIIDEMRSLDPSEPGFYGHQDASHLPRLEQLLGVRLPPSYRSFLVNYGGGDGFTGLYGSSPERLDLGCLVGDNQRAREKYSLSNRYVLIEISPFGEIYCLDTGVVDDRSENPVLMFPVGRNNELLAPKQVASSFGEYFHAELLSRLQVLRDELGESES